MIVQSHYEELVLPQKDEALIYSGETTFLEVSTDEFIYFLDNSSGMVKFENVHFVDGAMRVLHLGPLKGRDGILRPILGGHIGAVRLSLINRHLNREEIKLQRLMIIPREINGNSGNSNCLIYGIEEKNNDIDYESNKQRFYSFIIEEMKKMEISLVNCDSDLIILDGLLSKNINDLKNQPILGVIKNIKEIYLNTIKHNQLITMKEGFRSPVFLVYTSDFSRASWYLRLNGDYRSGYEGIIRLEISLDYFKKVGTDFINQLSQFLFSIRYALKDSFGRSSLLLPILEAEKHLYSFFDSPLSLYYYFENKLKEVGVEPFR